MDSRSMVEGIDWPGWLAEPVMKPLLGEIEGKFNQTVYADKPKVRLLVGPDRVPLIVDEATLATFCPGMTCCHQRDSHTNAFDVALPAYSPMAVLVFIWWCYEGHLKSLDERALVFSPLTLAHLSLICQDFRLSRLGDWVKSYAELQFFDDRLFPDLHPKKFAISLPVLGTLWNTSNDTNPLRHVYVELFAYGLPLITREDGSKFVAATFTSSTMDKAPHAFREELWNTVRTRELKGNQHGWLWGLDLPGSLINHAFLKTLDDTQKTVLKHILKN
ncbi:uncharacterized protein BKCO1_1800034 [Diplodia corticola]|uniref:Uncharacterized protein n=1 Tax=Diplodia corticola TaxID=236234 RepID=A0A1J9R4V0_9PEZI|nr:uncharacterized protein BKCO1_1800034 [Diplodia corticola]OJD35258.1 hypothetical protein BKCO1_1800034 [Diplodia corticola]